MSGLPFPEGVVHLHLTTRCNHACSHCYSSSGPGVGPQLPLGDVERGLRTLAEAGFAHLSVSGGEPTLYPDLPHIVAFARAHGFSISVVTNGLVTSERVLSYLDLFDTVAVSLDGLEDRHDVIRLRHGSFQSALTTIEQLAARGTRVAGVMCVTSESLADVPDVWSIIGDLGAGLLQVRPLVSVGRAAEPPELQPQPPDLDRLGVSAALLSSSKDGPGIQCDLAPTLALLKSIDQLVRELRMSRVSPAAALSPLVIDEFGLLRPYSYNMLGLDFARSLNCVTSEDIQTEFEELRIRLVHLHERVRERVASSATSFVDWFALLVEESTLLAEHSPSLDD